MEECIICMEDIKNEFFITHCGHTFHNDCMKEWTIVKKNCPMCRTIVMYNPHIPFMMRCYAFARSYWNSKPELYDIYLTDFDIDILIELLKEHMLLITEAMRYL